MVDLSDQYPLKFYVSLVELCCIRRERIIEIGQAIGYVNWRDDELSVFCPTVS